MLRRIEVYNFMSIEHGVVEFDDTNIINIKGYNDSGKSAILRALDVLFYNIRPNAQVNFIKDDCDYFRVLATFDDGVTIMRDKYINGQSLYEMYKDNECIYTTKVNGVLARVTDVPEPIKEYLGLLQYDNMMLNSRSCFEKQFLVQTTGSENYKVLNVVLRAEELAVAGNLLNNDKNALGANISQLDSQIDTYKELCKDGEQLTEGMLSCLEDLSNNIDTDEERLKVLGGMQQISMELGDTYVPPKLPLLDTTRLGAVSGVHDTLQKMDAIKVHSEVDTLDTDKLSLLSSISSLIKEIDGVHIGVEVDTISSNKLQELLRLKELFSANMEIPPELQEVNSDRLRHLDSIVGAMNSLKEVLGVQNEIDVNLAEVGAELEKLKDSGDFRTCPNCGSLVPV